MTNKEAIEELKKVDTIDMPARLCEAHYMAIKSLEQEPKTGHWIFDDECKEHGHCSQCGYGSVDLVDGESHNYCRNCGAWMVEPQESEEV